jgi:hypothetical protein
VKKFLLIIFSSLAIPIVLLVIWWNLPMTINRYADIKLGDKIICNIENFQKTNGLPEDEDWTTLKKFEFRDKIDFLQPEYKKLDNKTFELIYLEGFDGPYLMWNSKERIWKKGYPTFLKRSPE